MLDRVWERSQSGERHRQAEELSMAARKILTSIAGLTVAAVALTSVATAQSPAAGESAVAGGAEGKTFSYIPHLTGHPVWLIAKDGWDANAAENGFTAQWIGSTEGKSEELVAALDAAIVQQVDGIAIAAINPSAMAPSIDRAVEAGIPVVTILADAAESTRQAFLGSDVVRIGQLAAQGIIEATGGTGEVGVIVASLDIENQRLILDAFTAELAAKAPDMTIVATEADNSVLETSAEKVAAILTAHPDVKGIFGINANVPIAACQVFKERGITAEQVAMVGMDDLEQTLACIRDGTIAGSVAQNFYGAGYLAGDLLTALSNGETVPEVNDSGVALVTPATIDTYSTDFRDFGN
ncbi:MAG: substrate-binding domain-containing protein [Chloroflexota bacterium]